MAGRWLTRMSEQILADLEREPDFWPWMLDEVSGGMTPKKVIEKITTDYCVTWGALWRWINGDEKRKEQWAQARQAQAEWYEYERIEIADDVKADKEEVAKAKLRSDVRHSIAAAHAPGTYGRDKDSGSGGITVVVQRNAEVTVQQGDTVLTIPAENQQETLLTI